MIELLPCPFCGGAVEIVRYGGEDRSTLYACTECNAFLETNEEEDHGRVWNRRPGFDTELLAIMEAERDEADRRAGAAERRLAVQLERERKRDHPAEAAGADEGHEGTQELSGADKRRVRMRDLMRRKRANKVRAEIDKAEARRSEEGKGVTPWVQIPVTL